MAKKRKKKGRKMSTTDDKPKNGNPFFGDEIIRVRKARFVDGQSVGSYLRDGGTKGQLRAAIKSGTVAIDPPKTATE